jgi:hypothetical protein
MMKERTKSDLGADPVTGADLGSGYGQGAESQTDPVL